MVAATRAAVTGQPMDGWLRSLAELRPVPESYRDAATPMAEALRLLRVPPAQLQELLAHGFPHELRDGVAGFDWHDVYNVALHSRSGRSAPELMTLFVQRLPLGGLDGWTEPHSWVVDLSMACPWSPDGGPDVCGEDGRWRFRRPVPEECGGTLDVLAPEGARRDGDVVEVAGHPGAVTVRVSLRTVGALVPLASAQVRDAFRAFVGRVRFQAVPPAMQLDLPAVRRWDAGDCISQTLLLSDELERAGVTVRPRRGLMLGMIGFSDHGWVDVYDADGRWKALDPSLAVLALLPPRHPGAAEFVEFCAGSRLNRVVPLAGPWREPVAWHACAGGSGSVDLAAHVVSGR